MTVQAIRAVQTVRDVRAMHEELRAWFNAWLEVRWRNSDYEKRSEVPPELGPCECVVCRGMAS